MSDIPRSGEGDGETVLSDAVLVERAKSDPEAFGDLYERYLVRVYRYVQTYAGNDEDAADLTQHVFVRALESLPFYQDRGLPFTAWLFRIARNAATDAFRHRRATLPWEHVPEALHPRSLHDPETDVIHGEALNRLRVVVARLDGERQEMLALRFAGGLTASEIALVVGKSEAAVKKQMSRMMRSLREEYRDEEK